MRPHATRLVRLRRSLTGLCLMTLSLGGCYSYRSVEPAQVEPSSTVRLHLADQEFPRLRAFIDPRAGTVSGEFLGATADSLTMVLRTPVAFQEVSIARSSVLGLEKREADVLKSGLITVGIVGGVGLLAYLGFEGRGNNINRPGPQPDEARIPLFRIGLPVP